MKIFHRAFSFAEVLLTITVIGVVAALTMPRIVNKHKKEVYVSQLAKSISQFEQMLQKIMVRAECTDMICTGLFNGATNSSEWNDRMDEEVNQSIKVIKTVRDGQAVMPRIRSVYLKPKDDYTSQMDWADPNGYKFITPDGAFYLVKSRQCEATPKSDTSIIKNFCADVIIDVNGERLPNQYGRDLFQFIVAQNGHLYPIYSLEYAIAVEGNEASKGALYWENNMDACIANIKNDYKVTSSKGIGCAARVMGRSWKMDY